MTKALAIAGFFLITLIWGSTFAVIKNSLDVLSAAHVLAYRFTIASAGLGLIFFRRLRRMTARDFSCGALLGFLLGLSYIFQTYGLQYTTASKNAFITTLYVVLVPFLHWILNGRKPGRHQLLAAAIAVTGLAFISLNGVDPLNIGDFLTFLCSICLAWHMVYVDRYTERRDPIVLTVIQVMTATAMFWILALVTEGPGDPAVFGSRQLVFILFYLGIMASMVGFLVQNVGQKYLSPNTASILMSFESVFGLVFSVILLHEKVTGKMLLGCALMFAAAMISEYRRPVPEKKAA